MLGSVDWSKSRSIARSAPAARVRSARRPGRGLRPAASRGRRRGGRHTPAGPVAAPLALGGRAERRPGARSVTRRACVARRQAVDLGRVRADVADPGPGERLELVGVEALGRQDRPLVGRAAERVVADQPVAPDDPVARDDERDRVVAERRPDGPDRLRPADLGGDPAVRPDLAARDLERLRPDVALEVGPAAQVERDPGAPVAAEPAVDRRGEPATAARRPGRRAGRTGRRGRARTPPRPGPARRPTTPSPLKATNSGPIGDVDRGVGVGQPDRDRGSGAGACPARSSGARPARPARASSAGSVSEAVIGGPPGGVAAGERRVGRRVRGGRSPDGRRPRRSSAGRPRASPGGGPGRDGPGP